MRQNLHSVTIISSNSDRPYIEGVNRRGEHTAITVEYKKVKE